MEWLFYPLIISSWLTTFRFDGRDDFFPVNSVYTDDLTITLLDFQILKIMLFQHIDNTLSCS